MKKLVWIPITCILFNINAQKVELGGGAGTTWYKGDLQPTFRPLNPDVSVSIFGRYNANRVFSFKANGLFGRLRGDDSKSGNVLNINRGNYFRTTFVDYNVQAEYNFLNFRTHNGRYEKFWTPYLFGGLGQSYKLGIKNGSNPLGEVPSSNSLGSVSPNGVIFYGVGYKKRLKSQWNFNVELGARNFLKASAGERLDDFGSIPTTTIKSNNRIANTPQEDVYLCLNFSISYLFYKVHCP